MKKILTHAEVQTLAVRASVVLKQWFSPTSRIKVYPIPRGGVPVAYALMSYIPNMVIVDNPVDATCFVDDLLDSGATMEQYCDAYPGRLFFTLINKKENPEFAGKWVVFPWEVSDDGQDKSGEDIFVRLLEFVGEDPNREGLHDTPARMMKAWRQWTSGYGKDVGKLLKVFGDGAENYDQMVIVKNIPVYSHCEHHLAAIIGDVTIAYIPDGKIVGLSKLSRLADIFARRLQVQERMTNQIADALVQHLSPLGVGVLMRARHLCMESRGVCQQGHHTETVALRGVIMHDAQARAEFLQLATGK